MLSVSLSIKKGVGVFIRYASSHPCGKNKKEQEGTQQPPSTYWAGALEVGRAPVKAAPGCDTSVGAVSL